MRKTLRVLFLGSLLGSGVELAAQELTAPPPVLRIFREDIKEGKGAAHEKSESAFMHAAARAKYPAHVLGTTAETGPSQAWFFEDHNSFASITETDAAFEKGDLGTLDAADGELRSGSRALIAVYRPDLSYRAKELVEKLPKARYVNMIMIRVRLGQDQAFSELGKTMIAAAEKSGDDQPVATYQIVSGAPSGTYMLLEPTDSMKSLDTAVQRSRALYQAMGEGGRQRVDKMAGETMMNQESTLLTINPKMSYVSKEFAAGDPDFWTPKPVRAAKLPSKPGEKSGSK